MAPKLSRFEPTGLSHLGAMLAKCHKLQPKPIKTIDELQVALQTTWEKLPQEHININAAANFTKRLTACVAASCGQFEHLQ